MHTGQFTVYFMASASGTLYVGVTNDIYLRVAQHKSHLDQNGFTSRYRCTKLVYIEAFSDPGEAILREKQIKRWNRTKKIFLIEKQNPGWKDLSKGWKLPEAFVYG